MSAREDQLALLLERDAVADVIRRYAFGIDTRDDVMVHSCFARDARIQGTVFSGGVEEYLGRLLAHVREFGATMHHLGTQLIEVQDDTASAHTYAIALHFRDAAGTDEDVAVGVRYDDRLRREPGGTWRIVDRTVRSIWRRVAERPKEDA